MRFYPSAALALGIAACATPTPFGRAAPPEAFHCPIYESEGGVIASHYGTMSVRVHLATGTATVTLVSDYMLPRPETLPQWNARILSTSRAWRFEPISDNARPTLTVSRAEEAGNHSATLHPALDGATHILCSYGSVGE